MAEFAGVYEYVKDDGNFEALLKAMDVGFMTRKMANTASPKITIQAKDDGSISLLTSTTLKDSEIVFKLGEEFEEKRLDGVTAKCVMTKDGNKLIQKQNTDPPVEIIREFTGDKLIATCKCKDVVCVREYKKL